MIFIFGSGELRKMLFVRLDQIARKGCGFLRVGYRAVGKEGFDHEIELSC